MIKFSQKTVLLFFNLRSDPSLDQGLLKIADPKYDKYLSNLPVAQSSDSAVEYCCKMWLWGYFVFIIDHIIDSTLPLRNLSFQSVDHC